MVSMFRIIAFACILCFEHIAGMDDDFIVKYRGSSRITLHTALPHETFEQAHARIASFPNIEYIERDSRIHGIDTTPNDPFITQQWSLDAIRAYSAWDIHRGSRSIRVCVADTGVEYTHPDLFQNMDAHFGRGMNVLDGTLNAVDDHGHGTKVASIIGAFGNNSVGISGIAWSISIVPCKFLNANNYGWVSGAIQCLDYCVYTANTTIINISWGTKDNLKSLEDKLTEIGKLNVLIVAAAGNSGVNSDTGSNGLYPAKYTNPSIISVAASNALDQLASFSNYGSKSVDIAAPGQDMFMASLYGSYQAGSGTSFSAPGVAGALALMKSYRPNTTSSKLKTTLLSSSRKIPSMKGKTVSGGIVDVYAALKAL